MAETTRANHGQVRRAILAGRLVPFLGDGVNLLARPSGPTVGGGRRPPSRADLGRWLAAECGWSEPEPKLERVAHHVHVKEGREPLHEGLRRALDDEFEPNDLHRLLAALPRVLREADDTSPVAAGTRHLLVVTTSFDDALERAFRAADEPVDVFCYGRNARGQAALLHHPPEGEPRWVERPARHAPELLRRHSAILKLCGGVFRRAPDLDSFLVTEDDHLAYLAPHPVVDLLPVRIAERLATCRILFLGCDVARWTGRALLHGLWGTRPPARGSWSVKAMPTGEEQAFWRAYGVKMVDTDLGRYVAGLDARVRYLPAQG